MSFDPFSHHAGTVRKIMIPTGISADARRRLIDAVRTACAQQSELARNCDAVLKLSGDVQDRGDHLHLVHEPAFPVNWADLLAPNQLPDILTLSWMTWALARALSASTAVHLPHGALQPGTVLLDRCGRIKLTDFGIVGALESACGTACRRTAQCTSLIPDPAASEFPTGLWRVAEPHESATHGWLSPFLAPETLCENRSTGGSSDAFSLGLLLYLFATGRHAMDIAFSDPTLQCYFRLEPTDLAEARPGWAETLDRAAAGLALSADRPIAAWNAVVRGLLDANSAPRVAALAQAVRLEQPIWRSASRTIDAELSAIAIRANDAEGRARHVVCLDTDIIALCDDAALPELLRSRIQAFIANGREDAEPIAAAPHSVALLHVLIVPPDGRTIRHAIRVDQHVTIGRSRAATLSIPSDRWLSRQHARFSWSAGQLSIEDLGSQHGTTVNGARINHQTRLIPGDVVRAGATTLTFVEAREDPLVEPHAENAISREAADVALSK